MNREIAFWAGGLVWLVAVFAGVVAWERYDATPGRMGEPTVAPADPHPGWRLTAYLHPRCPCSRATLEQLATLANDCPELSVRVVFVRPPHTPAGWERGELWTLAGHLPGTVVCDVDGEEARSAGANTSGEAVLTDPAGRAVFRGGLTAGRGRDGESTGRQAVRGWVRGEAAAATAPVFGCPLHTQDE